MRGAGYLYAVIFVALLSTIIISYFSSVNTSFLAQKNLLNSEYFDYLGRQFLTKELSNLLQKFNYSNSRVENLNELGIEKKMQYYSKIGNVRAKTEVIIIEESIKKEKSFNTLESKIYIKVEPEIENTNNRYTALVYFKIISGKIPFFLLNKSMNSKIDVQYFLQYHNSKNYKSVDTSMKFDKDKVISEIIKVPENEVGWVSLRDKLNLRKVNQPVIDGAYMGKSGEKMFLYIKGNIDEIIIGKKSDYQFIYIRQLENNILLKYNNEKQETIFSVNEQSKNYVEEFSGNIMIDGDIKRLVSGEMIGLSAIKNGKVSAVKQGENLNLIIGGDLNIDSSLKYENISIKNRKFPKKKTNLSILQASKKLFNKKQIQTEVNINKLGSHPEIHSNMYFEGDTFFNDRFSILGSVYAENIMYIDSLKVYEDLFNYKKNLNQIYPCTKNDLTIVKNVRLLKIENEK